MFASLHNRSAYSFGTALTTPKQLAKFAQQHHMPAIALTDRNGLYAAIEFQQACSKAGVKPIIGAELPLACGTTVTLLARDIDGYGNLCRLVSLQHLRDEPALRQSTNYESRITKSENNYLSPARDHGLAATRRGARSKSESSCIDHIDLCGHAGGLICMVGRAPNERVLRERISSLTDAFAGRLYVELAIHTADDTHTARRRAALADRLGVPVVATSESRCPKAEQMQLLRALSSVGSLTLLDQPHPDKPDGLWHLRTPDEMQRLFARRPDALENTLAIAEQCNFTFDLSKNRFPQHIAPKGTTAIEYLRQLSIAGCRRRYIDEPPQRGIGGVRPKWEQVMQRIERELDIIEKVNYADYFLVFHEIVEYCRRNNIDSLARGSAADSLVCYVLGVSHACPFRFDLPFDRFINVERAKFSKLADIDLDLPWDRREEVIRWVYQRWGNDRVAMIGCSNTYHTRAAVAELGKVFGLPPHEVHRATRQMRHMRTWNLAKAIASLPEAQDIPVSEEPYRTIVRMAGKLDGLPRHWAMHPCGLVVSPEPLTDLIPVQRSAKGFLIAQYDMDAIEDLGFVKVDLLGQAGLSVLRDAVAEIERTDGVRVDLKTDVDYSDAATWDMIAGGNARGVHHIESPAMTSLLQQCNCRDIDCLTAVVAIIRPGAANQGKKEKFVRRHQGFEPPEYAHPIVEPILKKTYGLMVFEEHILQVATEFAGLNLGAADVLRRALNKQKASMIRTMKREFYASARIQWRREEEIDTVWSLLEGFSGFMFNKAHSAEYAVEAFQGAWLKRRWPAHYIAAILSNYRGFYAHSPTMPQILYVLEALRFGVGILPPCINRSRERFSVCYMNNVGEKADRQSSIRDATVRERREITNYELRITKSECDHSSFAWNSGLAATRRGARSHAQSPTKRGGVRAMIRLPVSHIKGLSAKFIERHLTKREREPFAHLDDFLERCRPTTSETQLLLDAGALDNLGHSRPELFWRLRSDAHDTTPEQPTLWHVRQPAHKTTTSLAATRRGALSIAECGLRNADCHMLPPVELTEPDIHHIAQREMDLLGFPISVDPWSHLSRDEHGRTIDWSRYVPVDRLHRHLGRRVQVCGLMVADRVNSTRRGELMKFVTLGDRTGFVEAILFPNVYQRFGYLTAANPILAATGIVEPFENRNGFTLRVQSVAVPARARSTDP